MARGARCWYATQAARLGRPPGGTEGDVQAVRSELGHALQVTLDTLYKWDTLYKSLSTLSTSGTRSTSHSRHSLQVGHALQVSSLPRPRCLCLSVPVCLSACLSVCLAYSHGCVPVRRLLRVALSVFTCACIHPLSTRRGSPAPAPDSHPLLLTGYAFNQRTQGPGRPRQSSNMLTEGK